MSVVIVFLMPHRNAAHVHLDCLTIRQQAKVTAVPAVAALDGSAVLIRNSSRVVPICLRCRERLGAEQRERERGGPRKHTRSVVR